VGCATCSVCTAVPYRANEPAGHRNIPKISTSMKAKTSAWPVSFDVREHINQNDEVTVAADYWYNSIKVPVGAFYSQSSYSSHHAIVFISSSRKRQTPRSERFAHKISHYFNRQSHQKTRRSRKPRPCNVWHSSCHFPLPHLRSLCSSQLRTH